MNDFIKNPKPNFDTSPPINVSTSLVTFKKLYSDENIRSAVNIIKVAKKLRETETVDI